MAIKAPSTFKPNGSFQIADSSDIKGGLHSVADIATRDTIPAYLLTEGSEAFVAADGKYYSWVAGVWVERIGGKDGVDGKDGLNGIDGKDGKDGVDGKDGKDATADLNIDMGNPWTILQFDPRIDTDYDCGTPAALAELLNG